jgi:thymidylate synthase
MGLFCVILARLCGLTPGTVEITLGDVHIYETHLEACETQLQRECLPLPGIRPLVATTLEDIESSNIHHYALKDYVSHPRIPASMVA